jgi:hypothetical protein
VPVVPVALRGLWGSFFSYANGRAMRGLPRKLFARIWVVAGEAMPPETVTTASLQKKVTELRGAMR